MRLTAVTTLVVHGIDDLFELSIRYYINSTA
jgi:hypothetical protein